MKADYKSLIVYFRGGNLFLFFLGLVMLMLLWTLGLVNVVYTENAVTEQLDLVSSLGWIGAVYVSFILLVPSMLACKTYRETYWLMLVIITLLIAFLPLGLIVINNILLTMSPPDFLLVIGPAYWSISFILLIFFVEVCLRLRFGRLWPALLLSSVALVWWLCAAFWLENLSLVREFQARDQQFWRAIRQHLQLVSTAVGVSVVAGLLLAMLMRRYTKLQKITFSLLNFLQTIPSIALFGLLLAPLAWAAANIPFLAKLGVSGIGTAPALIALIAYSLLPMVRNTYTALEEVSSDTLEAAKAMGMRSSQRFWQVRLPLALPVVLEGLRITTVQAVGLTAVAALIGAGGLGTFIFQGLGQAAMDMVLLGALPILLLALIVDAGIGALAEALRPGGHE